MISFHFDKEMLVNHLPLYVFLFIFFSILILFIYIKIKYPFWNTQPVFHSYDFWRYWTQTPFPIQHRYPIKTKYCDLHHVETLNYLECSDSQKKDFVNLLQCYYIPDESSLFVFHLNNLDAYMTGHLEPCYLSFYNEDFYVSVQKTPFVNDSTVIQKMKKPVGCISARTVTFYFSNHPIKMYFWDFICINREKTNKNLSRNLIQTQEYRQRQYNMDSILRSDAKNEMPIQASIFKKEVNLCEGIVPLVTYTTELFYIKNEKIKKLPDHFVLIEINKKNIDILLDFLEILKTKFTIFGICETPNLVGLIENNLLMVYCIQYGKEIYSAYFFRDARIQYDGKGSLLHFCGSIHNSNSYILFYDGFLQCLKSIFKEKHFFSLLCIENISHNFLIYENYKKNHSSLGISNSAYYLYNYVVPKQPFSKEDVFIVF